MNRLVAKEHGGSEGAAPPERGRQRVLPAFSGVGQRLLFSYLAILLAFTVLFFCRAVSPWYSAGLPQRAQTDALLRGELALSHNPSDLGLVPFDLCWSEGGVRQVWGLGVPLWRLPFEALAKLFGQPAFPDRVASGLFMALIVYIVLRTWFGAYSTQFSEGENSAKNGGKTKRFAVGFGALILCVLFAPLVNLLRSPMNHYEEVLVYVHFFGIALACGILALSRKPSWSRFLLLCGLAGLGGMIRPTLVFYGAATVVVASLIMILSERREAPEAERKSVRWLRLFMGLCLFAAGGGLLFVTNLMQFGSGWEFGHNLNLSPALPLLYMERFGHPFAQASLFEAGRELFGALFLTSKFNGVGWYDQGIFLGQSSIIRWRMIDLTTYDLSYAVLLGIAWLLATWLVWKWLHSLQQPFKTFRSGGCGLPGSSIVLILWSLLAAAPLLLFYLKVPVIASRYMLDFSPAFAVSLAGLWWWTVEKIASRPHLWKWMLPGLCIALITWQGWEISRGKSGFGPPRSITQEDLLAQMEPQPALSKPLPNEYEIGGSMQSWGIPHNGEGWNETDGHIGSLATFFIKDPKFLEIELGMASSNRVENVSITDIRAKVGLEFLERVSIERTNDEWLVRFAAPKQPRYQSGLQTLFLATVPTRQLSKYVIHPSPWILKRISWQRPESR